MLWRSCTGWPKRIWKFLKSGCGSQMSQATPTKFSMLFKHNYGKLFWKFGDHSFNFSFVHGPSWLRVLESIHRYGVIFTLWNFFSKSVNYILPIYLPITYLWPPIPLIKRAMDKGKIKAMVTKFSEKFAISMLKKHRKFCRCGLTHLDATPTF